MPIASIMWSSIASWFTPSILFCAANLIIATIFIVSNNNNEKHNDNNIIVHHEDPPLTRISKVSSFLHRSLSINNSPSDPQNQYPQQPETANYTSSSRLAQSIHLQPPSQLVRAPSFLDRVRSFRIISSSNEPETVGTDTNHNADHHVTRSKSENTSVMTKNTLVEIKKSRSEMTCDQTQPPSQLVRAPSFLDRVRSFRIITSSNESETVGTDHNADHQVTRSKSENTSVSKKSSLVEMKKSRSEMKMAESDDEDVDLRRPATSRERQRIDDVDEEVDAKADEFITRFKQRLKLQRIESLVRYNEMLKRSSYWAVREKC